MKKIIEFLNCIGIILFIIVASFQQFFAQKYSYFDELILLLLIGVAGLDIIYRKKRFNKKKILCIFLFLFMSIINIIIKGYIGKIVFIDLFNFFKILIMIEIIRSLEIDENKEKIYMRIFIICNMISIIYAVLSYVILGYEPLSETIKYRDGKWRISGFSGHPIDLGFACLFIIIYSIEKNDVKKLFKIFTISISIVAIYLTKSRLPQALLVLYFAMKVFFEIIEKMPSKIKKYILFFVILATLLTISIILYNINFFLEYLSDDIDNTIRMHSLIKSFEVFSEYPILGTGIGTFGNKNSVINSSFVYNDFNFDERFVRLQAKEAKNVFESNFAYVLIQTGISGIIFYTMFFKDYLKKAFHIKNNLLIYYLIIFLINFILNQGYMLIMLAMITLQISNTEYQYMKSIEN